MNYKHTQISYPMIIITISLLIFFISNYIIALNEPISYDSWANLLVNIVMILIVFIVASFISLQVSIDDKYLKIKFWYGIYKRSFLLEDIVSVEKVKNHWYCGWGIRICFWPKRIIYNIAWFDAVEIKMKNGKIYRIGTDESEKLANEIKKHL